LEWTRERDRTDLSRFSCQIVLATIQFITSLNYKNRF
jgi:hypothetical protein